MSIFIFGEREERFDIFWVGSDSLFIACVMYYDACWPL